MSKIIKAAELSVILGDNENNLVRSTQTGDISEEAMNERIGPMARATKTLEEAESQAETLVAEARQEAQRILDEAEQERETIRLQAKQDGWDEGYQEGQQTGFQEAADQQKGLLNQLESMIREATRDRAAALRQLEPDFLKLAVLVAEKIIRREISEDPRWLQPIIADALDRLGAAEEVVVRIHPKDLQPLRDAQQSWSDFRGSIHWETDDSLKRGTLICETEFGAIDASLEQRLGTLATSLLEVVYDGDE